jgi:hypothetical protein
VIITPPERLAAAAAGVEWPLPPGEPAILDGVADGNNDAGGDDPGGLGSDLPVELQLADPDLYVEEIGINVPVPRRAGSAPPIVLAASSSERCVAAGVSASLFMGASVGRVHKRLAFWKKTLKADNYVLNIICEGYKIPVHPGSEEIAYRERNNHSARMEEQFVTSEFERLVKAGLVVTSVHAPLCVNPLSVAFKQKVDGSYKRRLVLDLLRHINPLVFSDSYRVYPWGYFGSDTSWRLSVCL